MVASLAAALALLGALAPNASGVGPVVDAYFTSGESVICLASSVALRPASPGVLSFTCMDTQVRHGCRFVTGGLWKPFDGNYVMVNCERITPDAPVQAQGSTTVFKNGFEG